MVKVYILVAGLIIILSKPLLSLVTNNGYNESEKYIILGIILEIIRVLINEFSKIFHYNSNTKSITFSNTYGGIILFLFFFYGEFDSIENVLILMIFTSSINLMILLRAYMKSNFPLFQIDLKFIVKIVAPILLYLIVDDNFKSYLIPFLTIYGIFLIIKTLLYDKKTIKEITVKIWT